MRLRSPSPSFSVALAALLLLAGGSQAETPGRVQGHVEVDIPGMQLSGLGPIVVYLEAANGEPEFTLPSEPVTIEQSEARFSPSFRVMVRGQTLDMPNLDAIYHNVFSYSRPNDFDLGIYPAGETRSVTFEHAGVVKTYCSIHESMNATIFVAPSPYYDVVRKQGAFMIRSVPPGRYRLKTWCSMLPEIERTIRIEAGKTLELELPITTTSP